ncbi:5-oxoprolinase subunit B family protein [Thiobacillus sp.]
MPLRPDPTPAEMPVGLRPRPLCWRWVGERGLLVETGAATLARYALLSAGAFDEVEDIVPADGSVLVILCRGAAVSPELRSALTAPLTEQQALAGTRHEILAEYGGQAGPDLAAVAERAGLDAATYVRIHAAAEHAVVFLGFQPGFAYLRGVPSALHAPRRPTPRREVAVGSIAVGGVYTGIYPSNGPGGWNIIGRTRAVLFDPHRETPALLAPGDRVVFVPT